MALYLPRRLDLGWPQTINQVRRISVGVYPKKTPLCPTSGVSANCLQYSQVYFNVKGKAIHVRAISDPERSRMCRLHQISRQSAHEGGKAVNRNTGRLYLPSPTRKYSWYSFLLEAELMPGP